MNSQNTNNMANNKKKTIWQIYGERGGRPPKFTSAKKMQQEIDKYFEFLIEHDETPTITGMCLFLGFASRQSFFDYQKRDGFSYTVQNARMKIEHHYERLLNTHSVTGAIFGLKNMGWTDKTEIEQTTIEKKQIFKIGDQEIEFD